MSVAVAPAPWGGLPPLPDETFRLLGDLVRARTGLRFGPENRFLVRRRLSARLRALGLEDFFRYYFHLRYDPGREEELNRVFELLTVHETYFFREARQLRALEEEILPELLERSSARLRIWSAGCATGEEAYTLAYVVRQFDGFPAGAVEIVGTDLCASVLDHARRGLYGPASFRSRDVPSRFEQACTSREDGRREVPAELRGMVRFEPDNLLEAADTVPPEQDVILCRNVLIYLDAESRRRVVARFHDRLRPGGYLLLGHSESLLNVPTAFRLVNLRNDLVYQRPPDEAAPG